MAVRGSPDFAPVEVRIPTVLPAIGPLDARPPWARMSAIRSRVQASGSQFMCLPPATSRSLPGRPIVACATMPRCAESCRRRSGLELDRSHVELDERSVAIDRDAHGPVDEIAHERPLEIADARDA